MSRPAEKKDKPARGLRWEGLKDSADCPGGFAVEHTRNDGTAGKRDNA